MRNEGPGRDKHVALSHKFAGVTGDLFTLYQASLKLFYLSLKIILGSITLFVLQMRKSTSQSQSSLPQLMYLLHKLIRTQISSP